VSAFGAAEARWLEEPDRSPIVCHRHGFEYIEADEDCPGCDDEKHDYRCEDSA
jgi:hypothetical protein